LTKSSGKFVDEDEIRFKKIERKLDKEGLANG